MKRIFSTSPIYSAPVSKVDRENGIIQGITIARVGPAKGHGGFVDKTFLLQIVDNASLKSAGIKARFGHPNMCSQALGTYLGRFKNYSYLGEFTKADLYLDETAKSTPNGDLFTYVLDMAEKNPDMFGASIVFEMGESIFLEEELPGGKGKKIKNEYFRLKDLRATDIVDEPAATEGLFSANTFPAIATQFLDENPDLLEVIFSNPNSVIEFLSNYLNNTDMNLSSKIKANFAAFLALFATMQTDDNQLPVPAEQDQTLNSLFDAFCASYPESFNEVENFTQEQKATAITAFLETFSTQNTQLSESFNELNASHDALLTEHATTVSELETALAEIVSLNDQIAARPSIPMNVSDPAVSVHSASEPKDETGKELLKQIPPDIRKRIPKK